MPSPNLNYRAFISYSHRDAKWAKWLHLALERYVVPLDVFTESKNHANSRSKKKRRLTPIFRDRDELPASGSLSDTIQQALESSENLIVLCSPDSAASQYVNAEIEIFRSLHRDNNKKIYALIIEGEPPDCFPPALIAGGAEPIAADAREGGDGKADAKLKLIAGILGVGFDRLKRREAKRQRKRLAAILTLISTVAVITSVLALWALKAEQNANAARNLAEQRQLEAEKARRKAQDLAAFIGQKMLETLDRRGNSRSLSEVMERMDAYYKEIPIALLSQKEKAYYMTALLQEGELSLAELDLDAADDYSRRALALSKQTNLAASDPSFNSATLLRISFLTHKNTPEHNKEIITLLDSAIKQSIPKDQFSLYSKKGGFLKNIGDLKNALSSYVQAGKLAGTILTKGELGAKSIILIQGLLNHNHYDIGLVHGKLERPEIAEIYHLRAIKGAKKQLRYKTENANAMHLIFLASEALAYCYLAEGKHSEAMTVFHKREEITKKLLTLKPDNPFYQQALINVNILEARYNPELSLTDKIQLYIKALASLKAIPADDSLQYGIAQESHTDIHAEWSRELNKLETQKNSIENSNQKIEPSKNLKN